ncbi:MAG: hypothetical protein GC160_07105 [Acidobacteria bacterium]|nr:hypothetical protein [Acidobacteriota bacterium]
MRITGGSMAGAMKFAGKMAGGGLNNVESKIYLKGDKMARIDERGGTIIDLDAQTITSIDFKGKKYSTITFEQMKQALEQAQAKAQAEMEKARKKNPDAANVEMSYDVRIEDPKRSATVGGYNAKEMIMIISANMEDKSKGQSGAMNVATNLWLSKDVPGYEEVQDFHKRMAEKLAWNPSSGMLAGMQQSFRMGESMAKLQEESAKLEGMTVKQVMRMGGSASGLEAISEQDQAKVAEANEESSTKQAFKGLGSALGGGFGGFGKKKKSKEPEPAGSGAMKASEAGVLMEMTTESSGFSTAAAPADKFVVPAGFEQTESPMLKSLR